MKEVYILGAKINDFSLSESIEKIKDHLEAGKKGYIVTPNPEICLISYKDKLFRRIIRDSFLSLPDGSGLKIGAKIFGNKIKNITTGVDLCSEIIKLAEQKDYSILILGGKQEVGERTISLCNYKYPKLKLFYINGGNFNNQGRSDDDDLIEKINKITPDIIFICLGAPKQEYFMANNLDALNTKLMIGVGGTIDFLAEQIKRAPKSWRKLGLEWLWRLIQEPWRWKRIVRAVIIFPLACLWWRFGNLFVYRKNVAGFIINKQKQILITKHSQYHYWQIPQGGAKNAKTKQALEEAVLREMKQELGTDNFKILKMLKNCYKYKWPKGRDTLFDKFAGQKQTLFLLEFLGNDSDIKLDSTEHLAWQWISKDNILDKVKDFKRPLIKKGLKEFKDYL